MSRKNNEKIESASVNPSRRLQFVGQYILAFMLLLFLLMAPCSGLCVEIVGIKFLFDISDGFDEPSDVAVSKDGRIYVVDGVNNRIKTYDSNGKSVSSFGAEGSGNGQFRYPLGIDVDDSGKIYIADSGNHRVQIFDRNAAFMAKIDLPIKGTTPADPTDVAVDTARDRIYVVDNDNHRIFFYTLSTLKPEKSVGAPGEQDLMFRYPFLMTLDRGGDLYVVDVINTRVQAINPEGLFITDIGGWGVEKGEFFRPKGVAADASGRIFVSDSYMGVVQVFDTWGEFQGVLGDFNKKAIQKFKTPVGLFVDDRNRIYVVEMLANRVSVYGIETEGK